MKTKCILAGLIGLSIVALASFASLAAAVTTYYPKPYVSSNGNNWSFKTVSIDGTSFSGNLIIPESIVASYWNVDPNTGQVIDWVVGVPWKNLVINDNQVNLVFDAKILPDTIQFISITGALTNGDTFIATGPGWARGARP